MDFERLEAVAEGLRQRAQESDRAAVIPRQNLEGLAGAGLYSATASAEEQFRAAELLASACGVTHFVQTQHHGAISALARSEHSLEFDDLLDELRTGRSFCGVAFSHLRRPGPPPVRVRRQGSDFLFSGEAPWFTGWGVMDWVLAAGVQEDGRFLYAVLPTSELSAGEPISLAVMNASATVPLRFDEVRAPARRQVQLLTRETMAESDLAGAVKHSSQPLGVVRAACALLDEELAGHFRAQADRLRQAALGWSGDREEGLRVRSHANLLAVHAAQAAVVSGKGASNLVSHPAQRLVREAMFYNLPQLTSDLRQAHLDLLHTIKL